MRPLPSSSVRRLCFGLGHLRGASLFASVRRGARCCPRPLRHASARCRVRRRAARAAGQPPGRAGDCPRRLGESWPLPANVCPWPTWGRAIWKRGLTRSVRRGSEGSRVGRRRRRRSRLCLCPPERGNSNAGANQAAIAQAGRLRFALSTRSRTVPTCGRTGACATKMSSLGGRRMTEAIDARERVLDGGDG